MARTKPTYLYAIVSVALVLYILGIFGLLMVHASQLVKVFKERIDVWIELKPEHQESDVASLVQHVRGLPFVKKETVTFISREEAAQTMKKDLGEGSLLEDMPDMMRDVVRLNVNAGFMANDSLRQWREVLIANPVVEELVYESSNTGNIAENLRRLGWLVLGLGILLIGAAFTLIHNTIRLALYSNRFIIKNQELVGASRSFIARPYIERGVANGLWSAVLAIFALMGSQWLANQLMPYLKDLENLNGILLTFTLLTLVGILISGLSSYLVVYKFLRMRVDDLY